MCVLRSPLFSQIPEPWDHQMRKVAGPGNKHIRDTQKDAWLLWVSLILSGHSCSLRKIAFTYLPDLVMKTIWGRQTQLRYKRYSLILIKEIKQMFVCFCLGLIPKFSHLTKWWSAQHGPNTLCLSVCPIWVCAPEEYSFLVSQEHYTQVLSTPRPKDYVDRM